jgi:hypothetical protein
MFTYWIKRALVATSVMRERESESEGGREGGRVCDGWGWEGIRWRGVGRDGERMRGITR